jgi:hypothetical protein
MRDGAPLLRCASWAVTADRDLGLPFVGLPPAAFEDHGSCIEVAVSAEKRRHRLGGSERGASLTRSPIVSIVAVGVKASCNAGMRAMEASSGRRRRLG